MTFALSKDFCLTPSITITVIVLSGFGFNFNKSAMGFVQTDTLASVSTISWHSVQPILP